MVTVEKHESPLADGVDPRSLWYAPHPKIRTKAAADKARMIAEGIEHAYTADFEAEEHELFVALHTCAFRASRPAKLRPIADARRRQWADGWEIIRSYIVRQNLGLVYSMMGRFGSRQLDEDDLLSEAMYALARAVDRFNPWRGYKFSTYACNVIARAIMRRGKQEGNYRRLFPVQYDTTLEKISELPDASTELYSERLNRILDRNLGDLSELETTILEHRFPAERIKRKTFQQIGDSVGLSKERVRQIQNIALDKLREALETDPLLQ